MTGDKPLVTVEVSVGTHDRTDRSRRIAHVTIVTASDGSRVPFWDIHRHFKREQGIYLSSRSNGLMFISGPEGQVDQFLPLILAAVEAAGYEVVEGT